MKRFGSTTGKIMLIVLVVQALILVPVSVRSLEDPVWTYVGSAGFSPGDATNLTLSLNESGNPVVFFADDANGSRATVMQYDEGSWNLLGPAGFSADSVDNAVHSLSLVHDLEGNPYVAYRDESTDGKATVMTFNGSEWVPVGTLGFTPGTVDYLFLAIDSQDQL